MLKKVRRSALQRLAAQALELSAAAPQVVAHRVSRMAKAGAKPSQKDRREFTRMGSEKLVAFQQSWAAMWTQLGLAQAQAMKSLLLSPPTLHPQRAAKKMARLAATPQASSGPAAAWASVLEAGLRPVHRKAVANAKRLSRTRR
jgi:hypothetical protein